MSVRLKQCPASRASETDLSKQILSWKKAWGGKVYHEYEI